MPVRKIKVNGRTKFKYGSVGKAYTSRAKAVAQGRAIKASQARAGKKAK